MKQRVEARTLDFFDRHVVNMMIEKYGFDEFEAIRKFLESETYQMLIDVETALYQVSPLIIFDLWEHERATGDPRNSLYIRGDEIG